MAISAVAQVFGSHVAPLGIRPCNLQSRFISPMVSKAMFSDETKQYTELSNKSLQITFKLNLSHNRGSFGINRFCIRLCRANTLAMHFF